jgi:Zn-dependent membrane protease YugP
MFYFDPLYLLFVLPAILLGLWAQWRISSALGAARQMPTLISGYAAARRLLDAAGLTGMPIEEVPGQLSDHYDPGAKVLRLSSENYHGHDLGAVGIAAHEAGHALQDAEHYTPLVLRNFAVPMASIGSNVGLMVVIGGFLFHAAWLIIVGLVLFGSVAVFQLINLPVEYDASERAKVLLVQSGIIHQEELPYVESVLSAAALTYVASTLQSVLTLAYYVMRFLQMQRGNQRYT